MYKNAVIFSIFCLTIIIGCIIARSGWPLCAFIFCQFIYPGSDDENWPDDYDTENL